MHSIRWAWTVRLSPRRLPIRPGHCFLSYPLLSISFLWHQQPKPTVAHSSTYRHAQHTHLHERAPTQHKCPLFTQQAETRISSDTKPFSLMNRPMASEPLGGSGPRWRNQGSCACFKICLLWKVSLQGWNRYDHAMLWFFSWCTQVRLNHHFQSVFCVCVLAADNDDNDDDDYCFFKRYAEITAHIKY